MGLTTPASHLPGPAQRLRSGVTAKAKALVSAEATSVNTRPHFVRTGRCSTVISSYWVKKKKKKAAPKASDGPSQPDGCLPRLPTSLWLAGN